MQIELPRLRGVRRSGAASRPMRRSADPPACPGPCPPIDTGLRRYDDHADNYRMLFPTSGFLLFFLVVAAAMAVLETRFAAKKAVLVVASYYFYAQWDWRFCFLLAFSTVLSYGAGLLIGAAATSERRRLVLIVS